VDNSPPKIKPAPVTTVSRIFRLLCAALLLLPCLAHSRDGSSTPPQPLVRSPINPIVDLVLIYDGGLGRAPWTVDRLKPYVYRQRNGQTQWLYDGFLFLEPFAKSGTRFCPLSTRKDATQRDWQEILDFYFQEGHSIAALNQLLGSLAAQGHTPLRKRKVVIMLPTPIAGSLPAQLEPSPDWGELDGQKLDFRRSPDRVRAAEWYVEQVFNRWKAKHYQHLELAGFYWLFERAWTIHAIPQISQYIKSRGSYLYWIPSWPQGRTNWSQYGFDFVYQQPNYFFHRKPTPVTRLEEACRFAETCGTTMEMEFNRDLLTKPGFPTYFDEYLEAYTKHSVWESKPVAYYEGAGAWLDMSQSTEPPVKSRFQALADIIVRRQNKADAGFVFTQAKN
jgi:hypothetical protein